MLIYIKLSNITTQKKLFYTIISSFLIFFFVFTFILYPARDFLQSTEFPNKLQEVLPTGFSGLIAAIRNWVFSLFYIFSELWSSFVLVLQL